MPLPRRLPRRVHRSLARTLALLLRVRNRTGEASLALVTYSKVWPAAKAAGLHLWAAVKVVPGGVRAVMGW